jgi:amino acid adenylation domain-containing protein
MEEFKLNRDSIAAELSISASQHTKESEYWMEKLSGEPVKSTFSFHRKLPGKNEERFSGAISFRFPGETVSRLMKIIKGSDTRLHMVLVSAVSLLLNKYSYPGNRDIIVGAPIYKQETGKKGKFVNTVLTLRNRLEEGMSFKQLLLQVRQTITGAVENQNYPVETLLYRLGIPYEEGDDFPLFDTAVLLENIHDKAYLQHIKLNTLFSFRRTGEDLEGEVEYNASLYDRAAVERIIDHLTQLMQEALFNVDLPLEQVSILSNTEKHRLLKEFNDTAEEYALDKTIVRLFEEQVERSPNRMAVVAPQRRTGSGEHIVQGMDTVSITYRELNERSNRLARELGARGIKPGTIVALMMERSIDMIVGMMGILKAGGAYLPIDIGLPENRIISILEDCNTPVLLTHNFTVKERSFSRLKGLRLEKGKPIVTTYRASVKDLDGLPFPDRSLVDYEKYNRNIGQSMVKNAITMQATRGCPYNCAYCHKIWPKKHVSRSAENIFQEVKLYYDMGVRRFSFVDDIFNLDVKNSSRFFRKIIENKLDVQLFFSAGIRTDILTPEYIDLMVEAGTVNMALALETASPRLQKHIGKHLNLDKFRSIIEYLCRKYPQVITELFTMHGFPTETEEEAMMTLDFIKSLEWVHFPYINILKIYPGTAMEKLAIESGISRESIIRSEQYYHHEFSDNLPFDKAFTLQYQTDFLDNYFLSKERLLHVLPFQMNVMSREEMVLKYNSYLPVEIKSIDEMLDYFGISEEQLKTDVKQSEDLYSSPVPRFNEKLRARFPAVHPAEDAFKVLLMDLSQPFSHEKILQYDVVEPPLGLMNLMTSLNREYGIKINGKIVKSRIDFDSFSQLKELLTTFKPDIIGIRTLVIFKDFFHETVELIRHWGVDVPIITGGPYATGSYPAILQDPNIDLAVLGEGEVTFNELVGKILENGGKLPPRETLAEIAGLAFMEEKNKSAANILMLNMLTGQLAAHPAGNPGHVDRADHPAYVISTSGSTGKPKGVMIEHRNLHYLVNGLQERIYRRYTGSLNIALVAPYVFDASVKQIFAALLQGHCLSIVPDDTRADGGELLTFYRTRHIDISDGTPTLLRLLVESVNGNRNPQEPGTGVKQFLIGGEALPRKWVEDFFKLFGTPETRGPVITNVYGPSECSVDAACHDVTRENLDTYECIPIGTPLPNARLYILNPENGLQPIGVPGEICIAGHGVGRGYLNQPELTAQRFVISHLSLVNSDPNDQCPMTNDHLYHTGDLGRWLPDGNIEFLGRIDRQIKIRGYRIELEEIMNRLLGNQAVKEAAVVAREDKTGDSYLCAYFVPSAEENGREDSFSGLLRTYLSQHLPEYMVPAYFTVMEKLPLTASGKIDPAALPEPKISAGNDYTAPANEIETMLTGMWEEILGLDKGTISMDANFFEIGGHSLKATILIARIHRRFGVKLPLAKIFEFPTIRGMTSIILKTEKTAFIDLEKAEKKEYYPLSFHQKRLWYIQQAEPETTAFTLVGRIPLDHEVDPETIKKVLDTLMERHESFRTYFRTSSGEPVQFIAENVEAPLQTIDLSTMAEEEKEKECERIFDDEARTPCDMTRAPVFRPLLVKLDNRHGVFIFSMNHINTDGWSMEMLRNEFYLLYDAYRTGKDVELEPLEWQYKDFCLWQQQQMSHPVMREKAHRFWKETLGNGVSPLVIPGDFKDRKEDRTGAYWQFMIDNDLKGRLKKLADSTHTTLFTVMFSTYILLLSRFSNQEDIACSIIHSGRHHSALHRIMGFFVNSILFKTRLNSEESLSDMLLRVSKETMEVFQHQDYPLELVCEELKMKYPDISVCFNMLHVMEHARKETLQPFEPYLINDGRDDAKFDIETYFTEFQNGIDVRWMYKKNVYKPETMKYMIDEYINILDYFATNPDNSYRDYRQKDNQESIW